MALSPANARILLDGMTPPKVKAVTPIQPPSVEAPPVTAFAPRTGGPLVDGYLPPPPAAPAPPPPAAEPPTTSPPAAPAAPPPPFTGAGDPAAGSSSSAPATPAQPTLEQIMALINSNPALAQTQLSNEKAGKSAAAAEAAAVKNMLLGYGSQDLARQVLTKLAASDPRLASELGDVNAFVGAKDAKGNALISDNPDSSTSILAQLARTYRDRGRATDENFNDNGNGGASLFFSGARAGALNDLAYQHQADEATQRGGLEDKLSSAALGLTSADSEGEQRYLDAYQNAYRAALDEAMQFGGLSGGGPGGGPGGGGGDGGGAPLNIFAGPNAQPDPFANLNNLTPADWAKLAAAKKTSPITGGSGGGGRIALAV